MGVSYFRHLQLDQTYLGNFRVYLKSLPFSARMSVTNEGLSGFPTKKKNPDKIRIIPFSKWLKNQPWLVSPNKLRLFPFQMTKNWIERSATRNLSSSDYWTNGTFGSIRRSFWGRFHRFRDRKFLMASPPTPPNLPCSEIAGLIKGLLNP